MKLRLFQKSGFSLVELVIVVVIIGVIAAIAVSKLGSAASGADDAAFRASLSTLRSAIDLYYAEHDGNYPGADGTSSTFWKQLIKMTDINGDRGTAPGVHIYGPYVRSKIPVLVGPNPDAFRVRMKTVIPMSLAINESKTKKGWVFNYESGHLIANTDDLDKNGMGYDTY